MPLNTLRLNHAPSSHPNDRIVFIKPLPRPPALSDEYQTADTLLRAISAQCLPIMKSHHLAVTTLEEHEPNPEFIGRNFNNGEIIQLVLRGKNGGWLPINMIQMVMMHELAHNMHMNHGRQFWATRNMFAGEMRALWARGYTGEGFWGSGRTLSQLEDLVRGGTVRSEELKNLPVCGGTFRSRRRKRKKANNSEGLTWKEKKERRIEKKFGKNGVALGEDENKRFELEIAGKGPMGVKPRVAQSKRGRELRAAAALARFDTNKKEVDELEESMTEDETQTEDEFEDVDAGQQDARNIDGSRLLDSKGLGMIKICEEDNADDANVKQEMAELEGLESPYPVRPADVETLEQRSLHMPTTSAKSAGTLKTIYDIPQYQEERSQSRSQEVKSTKTKPKITIRPSGTSAKPKQPAPAKTVLSAPPTTVQPMPKTASTAVNCPICSLTNSPLSPTCTACAHVLDRRKDPRAWKCEGEACKESEYVNAGDVGVCGICGSRRVQNS